MQTSFLRDWLFVIPGAGSDAGGSKLALVSKSPDPHISHALFAADALCGEDRFLQWRDSIGVLYRAQPSTQQTLDGFHASIDAWQLEGVVVGATDVGAYAYARSRAYAARDGMNHYLLQCYLAGGYVGECDGEDLGIAAGDIVLYDLARPFACWSQAARTIAVAIDRELMESVLPQAPRLHGKVLRHANPLAGLLRDHILSLVRRLPAVRQQDAGEVARASVQMIAACLHPSRRTQAEAAVAWRGVTLEAIHRHIGQNLAQPLRPADLCEQFGLSRRLLYALFEPEGGVRNAIQQRRLRRAFLELAQQRNRGLRIADVAARCGFASESHFSHAFRRAFEVAPREVRALTLERFVGSVPPPGDEGVNYAHWLRTL